MRVVVAVASGSIMVQGSVDGSASNGRTEVAIPGSLVSSRPSSGGGGEIVDFLSVPQGSAGRGGEARNDKSRGSVLDAFV